MNCLTVVVLFQSRGWNSLFFSLPKKPSQAALSGEHALRDIERVRFALLILDSQPGQR